MNKKFCEVVITESLLARQKWLINAIKYYENDIKTCANGRLRIDAKKKSVNYYHVVNSSDTKGIYISKSELKLAKSLAQYDYDRRVLETLKTELKLIDKLMKYNAKSNVERIEEQYHPERVKLIKSINSFRKEYIEQWINNKTPSKDFREDSVEYYSSDGHRVRSKSEGMIADQLSKNRIPYHYESQLILSGETIYSDFKCLNIRTLEDKWWEHFGMMTDPTYAIKAIERLRLYENNGFVIGKNLIVTFESLRNPLNPQNINRQIKEHLK